MDEKDSLIEARRLKSITGCREITIKKKYLEALIYSHLALSFGANWVDWGDIEDIIVDNDKVYILFKERDNNE